MSAVSFCSQLRLLLIKNWNIRKRQKLVLVIELVSPLLLFFILYAIRQRPDLSQDYPLCHYDHRALPSAGLIPFFETLLCSLSNPCRATPTTDDERGYIQPNDKSLLTWTARRFLDLLASSPAEWNKTSDFIQSIADLMLILSDIETEPITDPVATVRIGDLFVDDVQLALTLDQCASNVTGFGQAFVNVSMTPDLTFYIIQQIIIMRNVLTIKGGWLDPLTWFAPSNTDRIPNFPLIDSIIHHVFCTGNTTLYIDSTLEQLQILKDGFCPSFHTINCAIHFIDTMPAISPQAPDLMIDQIFETLTKRQLSEEYVTSLKDSIMSIVNLINDEVFRPFVDNILIIIEHWSTVLTKNSSMTTWQQFIDGVTCGQSSSFIKTGATPLVRNFRRRFKPKPRKLTDAEKRQQEATRPTTCQNGSIDVKLAARQCQLDNELLKQFYPLLNGYILVAPNNAQTKRIIDKIQKWLDQIGSMILIFMNLVLYNNDYQTVLHESKITNGINLLVNMTANFNEIINLNMTKAIYQATVLLQSLFLAPDDAGAMLPLLARQLVKDGVINMLKCFRWHDRFKFVADNNELHSTAMCLTEWDMYYSGLLFDTSNVTAEDNGGTIEDYDLKGNYEGSDNKYFPQNLRTTDNNSLNYLNESLIIYAIRMSPKLVDSTRSIADSPWNKRPRNQFPSDLKYISYGFSFIQDAVDKALTDLILESDNNSTLRMGFYAQQFPTVCSSVDSFSQLVVIWLPLLMSISWLMPFALLVKNIVYEKEQRLKEVMKVMGLGNLVHWIAWFINGIVVLLVCITIMSILLVFGEITPYSSWTLLLFMFCIYLSASTIQAFFLSTLFSRANLAAAFSGVFYYLSFVPMRALRQNNYTGFWGRALTSLLPQSALGWAIWEICNWEERFVGAQWSNMNDYGDLESHSWKFLYSILMMLIDIVLYSIVTWYIEAVFPGQYGVPQPWYFFLTRSYWRSVFNIKSHQTSAPMEFYPPPDQYSSDDFERDPTGISIGINIANLRKVYRNGTVAVDNLSVRFYAGQITSFLGHNGAGKTTTMSILTGLYPATSGAVTIGGLNVNTDMDQIRKTLGFCPQHNILFNNLSVIEQLRFYAQLKGVTKKDLKTETDKYLEDVGIADKENTLASKLSGGQQRKLSIAIAFIGNTNTVILDEPTAGVDPFARRAIWDLLLKYKKNRTIVLSTHFMDEADVLGDRIAIVVDGRLRTCGSSLFLRNRFGTGYRLVVVRQNVEEEMANGFLSSIKNTLPDKAFKSKDEHMSAIGSFIISSIDGAQLLEALGSEMLFAIPRFSNQSQKLKKFFEKLDANLARLKIESYGISDTTLEEIFLATVVGQRLKSLKQNEKAKGLRKWFSCCCKPTANRRQSDSDSLVANDQLKKTSDDEEDEEDIVRDLAPNDDASVMSHRRSRSLRKVNEVKIMPAEPHPFAKKMEPGWRLSIYQFKAVIIKRFNISKRNIKGIIAELIAPVALIAAALAILQLLKYGQLTDSLPLFLTPSIYTSNTTASSIFYSTGTRNGQSTPSQPQGDALFQSITGEDGGVGLGICCMSPVNQSYIADKVITAFQFQCNESRDDDFVYPSGQYDPLTIDYNVQNTSECKCTYSPLTYQCPADVYKPMPRYLPLNTSYNLIDMTRRNISQMLLNTHPQLEWELFGGFSLGEFLSISYQPDMAVAGWAFAYSIVSEFAQSTGIENDNASVPSLLQNPGNLTTAFWIESMNVENASRIWYNNKGWATLPVYTGALYNALLRSSTEEIEVARRRGMMTVNYPMSHSLKSKQQQQTALDMMASVFLVLLIIMAFSIVPASFVLTLIDERANHSKHLQFVSGLSGRLYWLSNFTWDMANFTLAVMLVTPVFYIFDAQAFIGGTKELLTTWLLLLLYGAAIIPLMYLFTFVFSTPPLAFVALTGLNTMLGMISTVAVAILAQFAEQLDDDVLRKARDWCQILFLLLPQYDLGGGLMSMTSHHLENVFANQIGVQLDPAIAGELYAWKKVGGKAVCLAIEVIIFAMLVLVVEYRNTIFKWHLFDCKKRTIGVDDDPAADDDEDVAKERQIINRCNSSQYGLVLDNLTKYYSNGFRAVSSVCAAIEKGQCFGLLGVNGAGKTTTFKMLTGKLSISDGDAIISGISVKNEPKSVYKLVGYCPQFDALNALLTGSEQLYYYARIRGIQSKDLAMVVEWALKHMHLRAYADKTTQSYSGGNKRKLSAAIAMIGDPLVVLLDEPSTGMDPKTRRFMWQRINQLTRDGHTVLLTTHSMDECEAVCTRVGIMVNGRFTCMGSIQHLKKKFGEGYRLTLKLRPSIVDQYEASNCAIADSDVEDEAPWLNYVVSIVKTTHPSCQLIDAHFLTVDFRLDASRNLSEGFAGVQRLQQLLPIEDYSLQQSTLDDVFIRFARKQKDAEFGKMQGDKHHNSSLKKSSSRHVNNDSRRASNTVPNHSIHMVPLNDRNVLVDPDNQTADYRSIKL